MRIGQVKKLVIHELRPLGPGNNSDRRGPICDLMLADIPNVEHAIDVAARILQRVCSLLDANYFWNEHRDQGVSDFTEQFEAYIDSMPTFLEYEAVSIRHKYWEQERIDDFLGIMLHLAQLHGWEVEDRRAWEHEPDDREEEEFLEAIGKFHPEAEGDPDEIQRLAEEYAEAAHHMDMCPWRLLALSVSGICYCSHGDADQHVPESHEPGCEIRDGGDCSCSPRKDDRSAAKVIPFPKKREE